MPLVARNSKAGKRRSASPSRRGATSPKSLKNKGASKAVSARQHLAELLDPASQQQLKQYEEGVRLFQQQKFHRAKQEFDRVVTGPSRELADRARIHLRICEQRISRPPVTAPRTAEEHYHQGVAMMNLGHWDDARDHLDRALKLAPKADHVIYALAALDCLTGEADSALDRLRQAIQLRPENRYHARNDEAFAFLQEDPRFTELLYPEREIPA